MTNITDGELVGHRLKIDLQLCELDHLKDVNTDLLAATTALCDELDPWLTTADAGLPAVIKTLGDSAALHTAQRKARAAIDRATQ